MAEGARREQEEAKRWLEAQLLRVNQVVLEGFEDGVESVKDGEEGGEEVKVGEIQEEYVVVQNC